MINYSYKTINSNNETVETSYHFDNQNLIKPEDLHKHIGEVLMFHNGRGYIVSAVLQSVELSDNNEYSYSKRYKDIDYEDELDMSWFYQKDNKVAEFETLEYAYVLKCCNIHHDEIMHNIEYISVPTKEELDFRKKILAIDNDELTDRYRQLKEELDIKEDD